MDELEQAKRLLRIADSPDPKRACLEQVADAIIAAHAEAPGLTLRRLVRILSEGEVWKDRDEGWFERLLTWRRQELALENGRGDSPAFVRLAEVDDAA
jgi:hypothetical protein